MYFKKKSTLFFSFLLYLLFFNGPGRISLSKQTFRPITVWKQELRCHQVWCNQPPQEEEPGHAGDLASLIGQGDWGQVKSGRLCWDCCPSDPTLGEDGLMGKHKVRIIATLIRSGHRIQQQKNKLHGVQTDIVFQSTHCEWGGSAGKEKKLNKTHPLYTTAETIQHFPTFYIRQ